MEMNRRDVTLSGAAVTAAALAGEGLAEAAPATQCRGLSSIQTLGISASKQIMPSQFR